MREWKGHLPPGVDGLRLCDELASHTETLSKGEVRSVCSAWHSLQRLNPFPALLCPPRAERMGGGNAWTLVGK